MHGHSEDDTQLSGTSDHFPSQIQFIQTNIQKDRQARTL